MSHRNYIVFMRHMFDHASEAVEMTKGRTRPDLNSDRQLNLSLVRLLEIVGEAANRIPQEEQIKFPDIPWPEIISLRNRLIHGYDQVDFDILWQIVSQDLPKLIGQLNKILLPH
jgi:uncharacterized protein with HEPN domain